MADTERGLAAWRPSSLQLRVYHKKGPLQLEARAQITARQTEPQTPQTPADIERAWYRRTDESNARAGSVALLLWRREYGVKPTKQETRAGGGA